MYYYPNCIFHLLIFGFFCCFFFFFWVWTSLINFYSTWKWIGKRKISVLYPTWSQTLQGPSPSAQGWSVRQAVWPFAAQPPLWISVTFKDFPTPFSSLFLQAVGSSTALFWLSSSRTNIRVQQNTVNMLCHA